MGFRGMEKRAGLLSRGTRQGAAQALVQGSRRLVEPRRKTSVALALAFASEVSEAAEETEGFRGPRGDRQGSERAKGDAARWLPEPRRRPKGAGAPKNNASSIGSTPGRFKKIFLYLRAI